MDIDLLPTPEVETETAEDGTRFYITPDGTRYPSVTTVLGILSEKGIAAWRQRIGEELADWIAESAAERGSEVHELLENRILHGAEPDYGSMRGSFRMERVGDIYKLIWAWLEENIDVVKALEYPVWSDVYQTAGRIDLLGIDKRGRHRIVDFKTAKRLKRKKWIAGYFAQGAAYSFCLEERTGIHAERISIVIGVDHEPDAQDFTEDAQDWLHLFSDCRTKYLMKEY